ncbi:MAG: LexA family protein [Succinivibrionaceae bacterium]
MTNKHLNDISILSAVNENNLSHIELPISLEKITAGFPAPNGGYIDDTLDLNELCIKHPNSSFIFKVAGDSMIEAGILPGDYVVLDRAKEPKNGDIVIASVYNEFTIKYYYNMNGPTRLVPANVNYQPIIIIPEMNCEILGVIVSSIRKY